MLPIIAPPLRAGHAPEAHEAEPRALAPLFLLWAGLALAAADLLSPGFLSGLRLDGIDRHLMLLGLALPAFLSRRPFAQPIAAVLVGFAVLSFYLDYLRQGQLPS